MGISNGEVPWALKLTCPFTRHWRGVLTPGSPRGEDGKRHDWEKLPLLGKEGKGEGDFLREKEGWGEGEFVRFTYLLRTSTSTCKRFLQVPLLECSQYVQVTLLARDF